MIQIYLVVPNRANNKLPDPVKIVDGRIYFTLKDAKQALQRVTKIVGDFYGIYRGILTVEERVE